jgi:hypothetical protein
MASLGWINRAQGWPGGDDAVTIHGEKLKMPAGFSKAIAAGWRGGTNREVTINTEAGMNRSQRRADFGVQRLVTAFSQATCRR